jgi:hypothetical protein
MVRKEDPMLQDEYWQMVQSHICRRCVDGDGFGNCRLPKSEECSLKHFLPDIIRTVTAVQADDIETYIALLRKNICANCEFQNTELVCQKRNRLECALDRYYPLVIQIVELVKEDGTRIPSI